MEDYFKPFIKASEDTGCETPQVRLAIKSPPRLSRTLPYRPVITLSLKEGNVLEDEEKQITATFHWNPYTHGFGPSGFILLHHKHDGTLETVPIDYPSRAIPNDDAIILDPRKYRDYFENTWELKPGQYKENDVQLPESFQKILVAGEKYTLLWPGGEITKWVTGSVKEHLGQSIPDASRDHGGRPLVLPGGARTTFTVHNEEEPWPERAKREVEVGFMLANYEEQRWRQEHRANPPFFDVTEENRGPLGPMLSVTIDTPRTIRRGEAFNVLVKVTYSSADPSSGVKDANAITFHRDLFDIAAFPSPFEVYRKRPHNHYWELCKEEEDRRCGAFMFADEPPVPVTVGSSEKFIEMRLGETWNFSRKLDGDIWFYLPDTPKDGDLFRCVFNGGQVDWWDWGTKEEHLQTTVMCPVWMFGPVLDPKDNDGRPKFMVPGCDGPDIYFKEESAELEESTQPDS